MRRGKTRTLASVNYAPALLEAANRVGICDAYYQLCTQYPLVLGGSTKKIPYKEVLQTAIGRLSLLKLKGPGTVFQLSELPKGLSLNFIIQTGGAVETYFEIEHADIKHEGTFAILCNEARKHEGKSPPNPGHPRPICESATAMVTAFAAFRELFLALARAVKHAG
jgi:hypothetical protein